MSTGESGAESPAPNCLRCGGAMIAGNVASFQSLVFSRPPERFFSLGASSEIEAACCERCGSIELRAVSPAKLRGDREKT